ncbi:5-carboxymethyl-2-hydroxymuconate isomerase [Clostridium sp. MF28]|uniref:Fumarylacetoacetase-like C-terminal domain-containing protein n=1 Tax=Clostridium diolis TaxID=223919 RepID=A0AAV3W7E3_9CLOT|nr:MULTISPECIES: fumarylacetoacetate hydrolase family protein [Clostridium]AVK47618.1 5-carboxymethyl-2-hydroxymuconate isomerase [Clostridium sp. MF28]PSM55309.1 FAA hydrolase family protein [Clostridium diolis]QES74630.1 fumarylacetoacetate hydrolase family protein [Clostridium diolis]GEA32996.1 hypothetical protein CDIOL_39190 [Clostridium diolis]
MKFINYKINNEILLGIKTSRGIVDVKKLANNNTNIPTTIEELIKSGENKLKLLSNLLEISTPTIEEENIEYAPCVLSPEKILCVGGNYKEHGKECKLELPIYPLIFSKFNNSLAANKQIIQLPKNAEKFDYEAELVIIIGKEAFNVAKDEALSYVFGYTIGNDLSARDLQLRTSQWLLGKTCNNFAPIGPYLVTADEIDANNLEIRCEVNEKVCQLGNTKNMIFDCATIVSYISQFMTLKPGDLIFTGTPSGVIAGRPKDKQNWLKSGDRVVISIENLGTLINILN